MSAPMPLHKKLYLIFRNNAIKVIKRQSCCGHPGESAPGQFFRLDYPPLGVPPCRQSNVCLACGFTAGFHSSKVFKLIEERVGLVVLQFQFGETAG